MERIIVLARLLYSLLGGRDWETDAACWQNLVYGGVTPEHAHVCVFEVAGQTYELADHWDQASGQ